MKNFMRSLAIQNFVRSLAIPRTCAFPRPRTDGGVWRIPFFSASQDAKKVIPCTAGFVHDKFPQVCFRNARRQKTMTAPSDTAILTSVVIEGMRAYAHIGAHRSESAKPQPLQVTLRVTLRELDPETATLRETLDIITRCGKKYDGVFTPSIMCFWKISGS